VTQVDVWFFSVSPFPALYPHLNTHDHSFPSLVFFDISPFLMTQEVCVWQQERETESFVTDSLGDMGQGGDVEAYLSHQATHATGKCTLPLAGGIERCRVERFVWHEMRGTGNTFSPVTRSFQLWLGTRGLLCFCWLQLEVFLFKILQVLFFFSTRFFFLCGRIPHL